MNPPDLIAHLDHDRRCVAYDGETITTLPCITRLQSADGSRHWVIHSSLNEANANGAIDAEIAHHRALGVELEWNVYGYDTPPDLLARLERAGFCIGQREAVLIYDLDTPIEPGPVTDECTIVRVDHARQLATYKQLAEQIFAKDYSFTARALARDIEGQLMRHRGYIAYAGERPVGIGRLYTHADSPFGGLYGGGVLSEFRGRGFYRAIVAARARDAKAAGARYLMVDALPTSEPILERSGFERLTQTWPCVWKPDAYTYPI